MFFARILRGIYVRGGRRGAGGLVRFPPSSPFRPQNTRSPRPSPRLQAHHRPQNQPSRPPTRTLRAPSTTLAGSSTINAAHNATLPPASTLHTTLTATHHARRSIPVGVKRNKTLENKPLRGIPHRAPAARPNAVVTRLEFVTRCHKSRFTLCFHWWNRFSPQAFGSGADELPRSTAVRGGCQLPRHLG